MYETFFYISKEINDWLTESKYFNVFTSVFFSIQVKEDFPRTQTNILAAVSQINFDIYRLQPNIFFILIKKHEVHSF